MLVSITINQLIVAVTHSLKPVISGHRYTLPTVVIQ